MDSPTALTPTATSRYQPEIDGLRAFAVIAVILHHFNASWLPSGYLGVDIFFVISGFVITASIAGRAATSGGRFFAEFYARRVKRLLPALLVCVAITSLLICGFNPAPIGSLETARTALWGQSNHDLIAQTVDYFAVPAKLNAFTQTWSLSVEAQFYLVFPILLWVTGFAQQKPGSARRLGRLMLLLAAVGLTVFVYCSISNRPAAAYFLMPARFWELAAGCLLFLGRRPLPRWIKPEFFRPEFWLPEFCLVMLGIAMFMPLKWIAPTTIVGVGLTLLLLLTLRAKTPTDRFLTHPWLIKIGLMSYSLYLWHWTVLVISRWTIGIHGWSIPIQVGLMLGLAGLSYRYIEVPCRNARWFQARWFQARWFQARWFQALGAGGNRTNWRQPIALTIGIGLIATWGLWRSIGELQAHSHRLYAGQQPSPLVATAEASYQTCYLNGNLEQRDTANYAAMPPQCGQKLGGAATATVYLLGDSHMAQFKNAIANWAAAQNFASMSVFGQFCQFPAVPRKRDLAGHITAQVDPCYGAQATLEANLLNRIQHGDTVFIGNALYGAFSGHWVDWVEDWYIDANGNAITQAQALAHYFQHLEQLAQQLTDRGAKVILLLDSAYFFALLETHDAAICQPQWFSIVPPSCNIPTHQFLAQRQPIAAGLKRIAQRDRVYLWDTLDAKTCNAQVCTATHYADSNHFTPDYAEYLFQTFRAQHPEIFAPALPVKPSATS